MSGRKRMLVLFCFALIIVLAACGEDSTEDKMYEHLEEAVSSESEFEKQQEPIVELEQKEQSLYAEIIDLGMDDLDEIKELSEEAIDTIEERSDKIAKEKESMDASKKEFEKINDMIDKLDDEKKQEKAEKMYDTMIKRYDVYSTLNSSYKDSLGLEEEMYTMLADEDVEQDELTEQISKVNDSYQDVLEANEGFNSYTEKYNEHKKEFYKAADLEVDHKESPSDNKKEDEGKES